MCALHILRTRGTGEDWFIQRQIREAGIDAIGKVQKYAVER